MLKKIIQKIKWAINPPTLDQKSTTLYINSANFIADKIKETLNVLPKTSVVSLGENCNSAWYIKSVGLKQISYPFDWTYSSPAIINHCINDNFKLFLDKTFIFPTRNGNSAGHQFYHNSLFNHRSPLKKEADYSYYERCVSRFNHLLHSQQPLLFVMTIVVEVDKRSGAGWAKGFNEKFLLPINQTINDMFELQKTIRSINPNCTFLFIEQQTESNPNIEIINYQKDDYIWIKHTSFQRNTGVYFKHKTDDEVAKIVYSALKL